MNGKERVISVIQNKKPDRKPVYGWLFNGEFSPCIVKKYGSTDAFEDKYDFDLRHSFPRVPALEGDYVRHHSEFFEDELPDIQFTDPNKMEPYASVKHEIEFYGNKKGRFVYAQTPGCFEFFNGVWGIENHLAYLLLHTSQLGEMYDRLADWTIQYANNLIDLGIDMIHVSDDWGSQKGAMFGLDIWKRIVYPSHKKVIDAVKKRGVYISLHCDGNADELLDGIGALGYDVMHPYQESAGMSYEKYLKYYRDKFVVMGGLDIQSTIGFGDYDNVRNEIKRVFELFKGGGLILCTTHMIQPHCTCEEAEFVFDYISEINR